MDPIVGNDECKFLAVCNVLRESKSYEILLPRLIDISRNLDIPVDQVQKIKSGLNTQTMTYNEALWEMIVSWRSKFSDDARLSVLTRVLRDFYMVEGAEKLDGYFKTQRKRIATYACAPAGVDEFLKSTTHRVLVISSMDKQVTATKLMDTATSTYMHDHNDFADKLFTSDSSRDVFSVACNYEFTLSEILGLIDSTIKCKAVVITEDSLDNVQMLCSEMRHVMVAKDALKWSHLSPARKLSVPKNSVKVSGKVMSFRELAKIAAVWGKLNEALDERTLLELVLDKEPAILKNTIPKPISYYVPRRISPRNLLTAGELFKSDTDSGKIQFIFVFTGLSRNELSKLASPQSTDTTTNQKRMVTPTVKFMVLDMITDMTDMCERYQVDIPIHWIEHMDGRFYWVKCKRKKIPGDDDAENTLDVIHKCLEIRSAQQDTSEDKFLDILEEGRNDTSDVPVIVSDTPGMGKTQLLSNLARKVEAKGNVVVFEVMSNLVNELKQKLDGGESMQTALVDLILCKTCGEDRPLARAYLNQTLNSGSAAGDTNLMLDGFDEVRSEDLELAGQVLKFIRSNSMARLWVSTRPHLLESLENGLQVLGHNIPAFDNRDQRECLVGYWKTDALSCLETKLEAYADECLDKLHKSMKSADQDIAGVPLQCMLIGELYKVEARNYANPKNVTFERLLPSIDIGSVTELYQRLIDNKLDKYFDRYSSNKYDKEQLELAHMFFSIQLLFPDWTDPLHEVLTPGGLRVLLEDVLNVGLLEMGSEDDNNPSSPTFIHRTVAEFFAALFVVRLAGNEDEVTRKEFEATWSTFVSSVVLANEEFKTTLMNSDQVYTLVTRRFQHHVVVYFLDNLIQAKHKLELGCVDPGRLAHSCATANFTKLFDFLRNANVFTRSSAHPDVFEKELTFASIRFSQVELVQKFCEMYEKARHNIRVTDIRARGPGGGSTSLLDIAVAHREYSVVEHLINYQGFRDLVKNDDKSVRNLLHYCVDDSMRNPAALLQGKVDTLRSLVTLNARLLEHTDSYDVTPLFCEGVHHLLLIELIILGANLVVTSEPTGTDTLLHNVPEYLDPEGYHELVANIPSDKLAELLQVTNAFGWTPLHLLLMHFDPDERTLQLFKELGADFNAVDGQKSSIIGVAVKERRSVTTIEGLIANGATWQHVPPESWSILHIAVVEQNFPVFQRFAQKVTTNDNMLLQLRRAKDWHGLGNISLDTLGVNVNAIDSEGNTILHQVAENVCQDKEASRDVVKLLLENGANIHALNKKHQTALDIALDELKKGSANQVETLEIVKVPLSEQQNLARIRKIAKS